MYEFPYYYYMIFSKFINILKVKLYDKNSKRSANTERLLSLFKQKSTSPNVSHQGTYSILFAYQRNAIVIHYSERKNVLYICALIFFNSFTLPQN